MQDMFTPQMRDELEDREGAGLMASISHQHRQVALAKRERDMKERLRLDVMKRNKNRKRNKLARQARRKQR